MDLIIYPLLNFVVVLPFVMGGLSIASSLFGKSAQRQQAAARNRARKQNYEHMLAVRKKNWYQQLSVYGAKKNQYYQGLDENTLAANRGYAAAQVGMNRAIGQTMQANEASLKKFLASGRNFEKTGKSIARAKALDYGAMMAESSRKYYKLTLNKEDYKNTMDKIYRQQKGNRDKLHAGVAFQPLLDLPPEEPLLESESLGGLDFVQAGLAGFQGYMGGGGTFMGQSLV